MGSLKADRSRQDAASLVMGTRASEASAGWRGDAGAPCGSDPAQFKSGGLP